MAVFSVAFDGTRVTPADDTTNWTADTITPQQESDFSYQGGFSVSGQVKVADSGFYYTSGAQVMNGSPNKVWIAKVYSGKTGALTGNGLQVRIGSGTTAYYAYYLFSATTYPSIGGWQFVAIDPNVSQWRSATQGSPNLGSVTYWEIRANYSANSRATNTAMDAIDIIPYGSGLTGTGGDSSGNFQSFATTDEGTTNNRWGIVTTKAGIFYVIGMLSIGTAAAVAVFVDTNSVVVFTVQKVTSGFCGLKLNIEQAGSAITINNCVFNSKGALNGSDDTRPDYTVTGTAGTCNLTSCTFNGYRQITLTSKVVAQKCQFILGGDRVVIGGADIKNSTFYDYRGSIDSAALLWDVDQDIDGYLDGCSFTRVASLTHAIEFGTSAPTEVTLRNCTFVNYNTSDGTAWSTLKIDRTEGTVTINVVNCTGTITYESAGATVNIVSNPVTLRITVVDLVTGDPIVGAMVLVLAAAGGPLSEGTEIIKDTTDVNGQVTDTRSWTSSQPITGRVRSATTQPFYKTGSIAGTINSANGLEQTVQMVLDQ